MTADQIAPDGREVIARSVGKNIWKGPMRQMDYDSADAIIADLHDAGYRIVPAADPDPDMVTISGGDLERVLNVLRDIPCDEEDCLAVYRLCDALQQREGGNG